MSYGGVDLEVDALVSTVANLIVVTTGVAAIDTLGAALEQVTLTPLVAERIAGALREALVLSDPLHRAELIARWQEAERSNVPFGRIVVDESAVHLGIEPIGAGALVSVLWRHVPALIWQLEVVAMPLRRQG